jgi:hypothetical protein
MYAAVCTGVAVAGGAIYFLQPAGVPPTAAAEVPRPPAVAAPPEPPPGQQPERPTDTAPPPPPGPPPRGGGGDDPVGRSRVARQRCTCALDFLVLAAIAAAIVWVLRRDLGFDVRGALASVERVFSTEAKLLRRLLH